MQFITVDRKKCKRDGICMAECPFGLIDESADGGFPESRRAAPRICIECGHCVAVCPHQALTFKEQGPADCLPIDRKIAPTPAAVGQLLRSRRSIRTYKDKPVPRETLAEILDICRWAPSVKNGQPTHWLMIESAAEMRRLTGIVVDWLRENKSMPGVVTAWDEGRDLVLRHAPHLAIAHASSKALKPDIDCTIAMTYFDLAAHGLGLGTCWAGIFMGAAFSYQPLIEALKLPADHQLQGALMLGYPKFRYQRIPQRHPLQAEWR